MSATVMKLQAKVVTTYELLLCCDGSKDDKENVGRLVDTLNLSTMREFGDVVHEGALENTTLVELNDEEKERLESDELGIVFFVDREGGLS